MRRRRWFAFWVSVVTVALVVVLRPLAHASPADPTWIAGFYDGADFDDVVNLIVTGSGLGATGVAIHRPAPRVPDTIASPDSDPIASVHGSSPLTRAPPLPFGPPV
ncbi:MAG: hypothetical protein ACHQ8D_19085 [Candidatus Rokuibacteriota bacterium]|jgi:hypothetical protein